jgi:hypothetical protein
MQAKGHVLDVQMPRSVRQRSACVVVEHRKSAPKRAFSSVDSALRNLLYFLCVESVSCGGVDVIGPNNGSALKHLLYCFLHVVELLALVALRILSCFPETDCDDMVWFRIRDHYDLVHEPGLLSEDREYLLIDCVAQFACSALLADGLNNSGVHGVSKVGKPGQGDGEFQTPHGLWVDPRGDTPILTVADRGNRRIHTFTLKGAHLKTIKNEEHIRMPCNFHTQGEWMVCPDLDSQVYILDRELNVVAQLGDGKAENGEVGSRRGQSRSQFTSGKFMTPHDAIFLQNGDVLVAEWLPIGRLTLLRRT